MPAWPFMKQSITWQEKHTGRLYATCGCMCVFECVWLNICVCMYLYEPWLCAQCQMVWPPAWLFWVHKKTDQWHFDGTTWKSCHYLWVEELMQPDQTSPTSLAHTGSQTGRSQDGEKNNTTQNCTTNTTLWIHGAVPPCSPCMPFHLINSHHSRPRGGDKVSSHTRFWDTPESPCTFTLHPFTKGPESLNQYYVLLSPIATSRKLPRQLLAAWHFLTMHISLLAKPLCCETTLWSTTWTLRGEIPF